MGSCVAESVEGCGRILVCRDGLATRLEPALTPRGPGQIFSKFDLEGDKAYYTYMGPGGGGFLVEASITGLETRGCGEKLRAILVPLIMSMLRGDPGLPRILFIVEEKMLR